MGSSLVDKYSKEELKEIVANSYSKRELLNKLGYSGRSGARFSTVQKRLEEYNISINHFFIKKGIKRTEENVFIENSTATQATLRNFYLKGNYTQYKCNICKQEPFWNEKELSLTLDHINGNNKDNRLENLRWVCPNCDRQLSTFGSKNKKELLKKENIKSFCIDCGKEISKDGIRCIQCLGIFQRQSKITREELKDKIRNQTFTSIGREFNISDNAIRKWCKTFNLPTHKTEIKNYTDEEWLKI